MNLHGTDPNPLRAAVNVEKDLINLKLSRFCRSNNAMLFYCFILGLAHCLVHKYQLLKQLASKSFPSSTSLSLSAVVNSYIG